MIEQTATTDWMTVDEMMREVTAAREARDAAVERWRLVTQQAAVWAVEDAGMSRKDAGAVLGLSHQRISQLLDAAGEMGGAVRRAG